MRRLLPHQGTELIAHHMRMEAIEVLLKDVSTESTEIVPVPGEPTGGPGEGQDWDDHTLVEVALFLQPAW